MGEAVKYEHTTNLKQVSEYEKKMKLLESLKNEANNIEGYVPSWVTIGGEL